MILFNSKTAEWDWLSNFTLDGLVDINGAHWRSVEHYYQAMKTKDPQERAHIANASTARDAKARGKNVTMRGDWDQLKLLVMYLALRWRFTGRNKEALAQRLVDTGNRKLVHYCPWGDRFWGIDGDNKGKNHMGTLLMILRKELQ